jgi:hypothetical protein
MSYAKRVGLFLSTVFSHLAMDRYTTNEPLLYRWAVRNYPAQHNKKSHTTVQHNTLIHSNTSLVEEGRATE